MTKTKMLDNVSLETYLRDPRLSTHLLSRFADQGPRMFIMVSGAMIAPKEQSDEQRMGQMFEDIVQGRPPDLTRFAAKPEGMSFATKEGKTWKSDQLAKGLEIIPQADLDSMQWMHESFLENEQAMDTIRHAKKQVTLYRDVGRFGLKSRPDYLIDSLGKPLITVDLKTCSSLNVITSGRQVRDYRYHCQAALCRRLLRDRADQHTEHYLLAVEKQTPYRCQLVRIPHPWMDAGDRWIDEQIEQIEACARRDSWPRVLSEVVDLPPPPSWL